VSKQYKRYKIQTGKLKKKPLKTRKNQHTWYSV